MSRIDEAELREIRKLWDEMQYIRTGGINALFAHIDALAAEYKAVCGRYDDAVHDLNVQYEKNHALAAEVERLRDLVEQRDSLLREAEDIITAWRRLETRSILLPEKADAWLKKAKG